MLKFPASRAAQDPATSASRRAFLRSKSNGEHERRFCEALADAYKSRPGTTRRGSGYPWVSLVLGSGCVERLHLVPASESTGPPHRQLPHLVRSALKGYPHFEERDSIYSGDPEQLAYDFIASLLKDRFDEDPDDRPGSLDPESKAHAATLCLLAAVLTRLYFASKVQDMSAPVTRGEEVVECHDDDGRHPIHVYRKTIRGLRNEVIRGLGDADVALSELLKRIGADLSDNRVALLNVQLLTEIAWYHLTEDLAAYPGWSDMLAELAIRQELPLDQYADKNGPRPLYDTIVGVSQSLADLFTQATEQSWELDFAARAEPTTDDREDLHAAAARLLTLQAARYAESVEKGAPPPPASAFVTTFDLELEMALWDAETPFITALPVNVQVEGVEEVVSCWLGRVVQPFRGTCDNELAALRGTGEPGSWFVLSAVDRWRPVHTTSTKREVALAPYPVVVRLSGSPLMKLPELGDEVHASLRDELRTYLESYLSSLPRGTEPKELILHPAIIVDEYASLRQSMSELWRYSDSARDSELRQGLPDPLTDGSSDAFARYWMLMGVQLSDPGMRQRFSSQLLSPLLGGKQKSPPSPAGLAVAKRADDVLARDLVRWHGFDVVRAKCEDFTQDLVHCAAHLEARPPALANTAPNRECGLDEILQRQAKEQP